MSASDLGPAPLRIPAILQNPVNRTQRQVEAHNAQQREKVEAKRERERVSKVDVGGKGDRRGKRVIRRVDNAAFSSNPHIVRPSKADYYPTYPHDSRPRSSLPMKTLPRSTPIPGVEVPDKDPFSASSVNGTFSTSLKGIRQALKKKGRRTEVVVQRVEDEIRGWLGGVGILEAEEEDGEACQKWRPVDDTLVESSFSRQVDDEGQGNGDGPARSRRMPARHRSHGSLPALPIMDGTLPAILELSRSIGHLTWLAVEGFERLVIHLVCRYYEVVSWSEDHITSSGEQVRLTHIIRPAIIKPRLPTGPMFTPENSDLSAPSSSDLSSANNTDSEISTSTESDTDSDAATEMGDSTFIAESDEPVGYSLDSGPDGFEDLRIRSPTLETAMGELQVSSLALSRTFSNSSSQYAESEGEAGSDYGVGMADSLGSLPPRPDSELGFVGVETFGNGPVAMRAPVAAFVPRRATLAAGNGQRTGWQDKPSFFEYLYGA